MSLMLAANICLHTAAWPCVEHELPWKSTCANRFDRLWAQHEGFHPRAAGRTCLERLGRTEPPCGWKRPEELAQETTSRSAVIYQHLLGAVARPWLAPSDPSARNIYLDLGTNAMYELDKASGGRGTYRPAGSIGSFLRKYPHADEYDIIAFEPNWYHFKVHRRVPKEARVKRLEYHMAAVGTHNSTAFLVAWNQWSTAQGGSIPAAVAQKLAVPMIDLVEFLNRHVRPKDFVVLKMDIENGEWDLLAKLLLPESNVTLIDEFFFECHHHETVTIASEHGYADCLSTMQELKRRGVWVHEWF
jgi:FkbM family methyltransferase